MPKLTLIALMVAMATVSAHPIAGPANPALDEHWEQFKKTYNKVYEPEYEYLRRLIWEDNLQYIQQHNLEYDMGKHSYALGLNHFTDMTHDEFLQRYMRHQFTRNGTGIPYMRLLNVGGKLPDKVDWRDKGYVTPVKDQAHCGSCWSFSSTGSLEGQYFRKNGVLKSFSEQQLVDCSAGYGNNGCDGGIMDNSFRYWQDYKEELESDYPYEAEDGKCRFRKKKTVTGVTGKVDIPGQDEDALKEALATVGPISVAIDASHKSFQMYHHGVYDEPLCHPMHLDHAVLAVGYGTTEDGMDYWIIKNSWGTVWGDKGFIKMRRNNDNRCGVASMASYPIL